MSSLPLPSDVFGLIFEQLGNDLESIAHLASVCKSLRRFIIEIGFKNKTVVVCYDKTPPTKYLKIDDNDLSCHFFAATIATHIHHRIYNTKIKDSLMNCKSQHMTIEAPGWVFVINTNTNTYSVWHTDENRIVEYIWPCQPRKLTVINSGNSIHLPDSVEELELIDSGNTWSRGCVNVSGQNLCRIFCKFSEAYYKELYLKETPMLKSIVGYVDNKKSKFANRHSLLLQKWLNDE